MSGPWKKPELPGPVVYTMEWPEPVLLDYERLLTEEYHPDEDGLMRRTPNANVVGAYLYYLFLMFLVGISPAIGVPVPAVWAGLGVLAALFVVEMFLLVPRVRRKTRTRIRDSLTGGPQEEVRLGPEGIATSSADTDTRIRWHAVSAPYDIDSGLALDLPGGGKMVVPDVLLPEGMDRAEVYRRVTAWQEAAGRG